MLFDHQSEIGDERNVLLILCDISGYTQFMIANSESRRHSYVVITALMKALLKQASLPLKVAKLEGDAVFLYAFRPKRTSDRELFSAEVMTRLDRLFLAFQERLSELSQANICHCEACKNVEQLRLKMVVHSGSALIHRVGKFEELAGVDVILAHRLLKNHVDGNCYLLVTEQAREELGIAEITGGRTGEETYDELGTVRTLVLELPLKETSGLQAVTDYGTLYYRAKDILTKIFISRLMQIKLIRRPAFGSLPP